MKKVTIGGLILLSVAISACHSTTESEIITSDSITIHDSITTTSVFDKTEAKDTVIIDTIKK